MIEIITETFPFFQSVSELKHVLIMMHLTTTRALPALGIMTLPISYTVVDLAPHSTAVTIMIIMVLHMSSKFESSFSMQAFSCGNGLVFQKNAQKATATLWTRLAKENNYLHNVSHFSSQASLVQWLTSLTSHGSHVYGQWFESSSWEYVGFTDSLN